MTGRNYLDKSPENQARLAYYAIADIAEAVDDLSELDLEAVEQGVRKFEGVSRANAFMSVLRRITSEVEAAVKAGSDALGHEGA